MGKSLAIKQLFFIQIGFSNLIFLRFKLQSNYILLGYRPQTWQFYLMFLFFFFFFHALSFHFWYSQSSRSSFKDGRSLDQVLQISGLLSVLHAAEFFD